MFYPVGCVFAGAELNVEMVSAVEVNDKDSLAGVNGWTGIVLVTDVETETQLKKAATLIETIFPNL